jgi:hypothetical protein
MFPKKGNFFPGGNDRDKGGANYAAMIAAALRVELGDSHRATKTVMRWTGASERTVKHWLAGRHGPGGAYLVDLMRESEAVLEAMLAAADRRDAVVAARVLAAHGAIVEVMGMVKRERNHRVHDTSLTPNAPVTGSSKAADSRTNDPINVLENVPVNPPSADGLNARQRWFVAALEAGRDVTAPDLARRWSVSEKTARRDIATLRRRGVIEFVGSFRQGRYRMCPL